MPTSPLQSSPKGRAVAAAFCADKFMEAPLHVAAASLLRSLHPDYSARLYFLLTGFSDRGIRRLRSTLDRVGRSYTMKLLAVADPERFTGLRPFYGSHIPYHRLLLPELIDEERFLYLDSDTQVQIDISPLFSLEMGGKPVGFVASGVASKGTVSRFYMSMGLDPQCPIFNSGVMLVNLPEWRRRNCSEAIFDICRKYSNELRTGDETALNIVFAREFYHLDPCYNVRLTRATEPGTVPPSGLFHFLESPRPWDLGGRLLLPHARMWFDELRSTSIPAMKRVFFLDPRSWQRVPRIAGAYYRTLRYKLLKWQAHTAKTEKS